MATENFADWKAHPTFVLKGGFPNKIFSLLEYWV